VDSHVEKLCFSHVSSARRPPCRGGQDLRPFESPQRQAVVSALSPTKKPQKGALLIGGERGIRTLDGIAPKPPFQGGAIGH
jgi:hypothetical protein